MLRSRKAVRTERTADRKTLGREGACCVPRTKRGVTSGKEVGCEVETGKIMLSLGAPGLGSGFCFKSNGKSLEDFHQGGRKD